MKIKTQNRVVFWINIFVGLVVFCGFVEHRWLHVRVDGFEAAMRQTERQDLLNLEHFYERFERHRRSNDELFISSQEEFHFNAKKILLIEESLDPVNTRWAKIKQVRDVVKRMLEKRRYYQLSTIEITAYAGAVVDYSERYDVPISLILAMTERESAFNPRARSPAGALGLIQIMPSTAKEIASDLGIRHYNLYKIKDNVRFGVYYMMKMLDEFQGDTRLALMAYNAGPTYVRKVMSGEYRSYPEETVGYIRAILGEGEKGGFLDYYKNQGL